MTKWFQRFGGDDMKHRHNKKKKGKKPGNGGVVQMEEQRAPNAKIAGSTPATPAKSSIQTSFYFNEGKPGRPAPINWSKVPSDGGTPSGTTKYAAPNVQPDPAQAARERFQKNLAARDSKEQVDYPPQPSRPEEEEVAPRPQPLPIEAVEREPFVALQPYPDLPQETCLVCVDNGLSTITRGSVEAALEAYNRAHPDAPLTLTDVPDIELEDTNVA